MDQLFIHAKKPVDSSLAGIPYVIRPGSKGRGLFSLLSSVVCHLDIANNYGLIPFVDMQNSLTEYNECGDDLGTQNAWEYYFEPVSELRISDLNSSPLITYSCEGYPSGYPFSISREPCLVKTFKQSIVVREEIQHEVAVWMQGNLGKKVLGVHWRAQEMRTAAGHWYPPNERQIFAAIDYCLANVQLDQIFCVSEDVDCINRLYKRYGTRMAFRDHYRTKHPVNAYKIYPRRNHKYYLGRECLTDVLILSRCIGLVACTSNMAEGARLFRDNSPEIEIKIDNGPNIRSRIGRMLRLHRYAWGIKNILPQGLGGFSLNAIERHDVSMICHPYRKAPLT